MATTLAGVVADAEQAAFALGHDLEPDRLAVESRREPLRARAAAAHFASPTVSPCASTETSSLIGVRDRSSVFASRGAAGRPWPGSSSAGRAFCLEVEAFPSPGAGAGGTLRRLRELCLKASGSGFGISRARDDPLTRRSTGSSSASRASGRPGTSEERDEDDREDEHHDPLRLLHRRGHEVRRGELARGVDHEQQRAPAVLGRLGDVDEPEEVELRGVESLEDRLLRSP